LLALLTSKEGGDKILLVSSQCGSRIPFHRLQREHPVARDTSQVKATSLAYTPACHPLRCTACVFCRCQAWDAGYRLGICHCRAPNFGVSIRPTLNTQSIDCAEVVGVQETVVSGAACLAVRSLEEAVIQKESSDQSTLLMSAWHPP